MKKLILLLTVFSMGCATTHPGAKSRSLTAGGEDLTISADPVSKYSDKSNIYLDFTLENTSNRWIRIDDVSIDFTNSENAPHNIIVGNDLKVWSESLQNKLERDRHNTDLAIGAMVVGGLLVAVLGGKSNSGWSTAGFTSAAVGAGADAARDIRAAQAKANQSVLVPDTYLLAPITIPSKGFLRRWLLVNIPSGVIANTATLRLKTVEGEILKFEVPIKFRSAVASR